MSKFCDCAIRCETALDYAYHEPLCKDNWQVWQRRVREQGKERDFANAVMKHIGFDHDSFQSIWLACKLEDWEKVRIAKEVINEV